MNAPALARVDEIDDLYGLLMDHAAGNAAAARQVAWRIATASMGENHLWEDLRLGNRDQLSALLRRHFPALHAKNTGNMKWKKFFYRQLCEREGLRICRAPSCGVCGDYPQCFGPE